MSKRSLMILLGVGLFCVALVFAVAGCGESTTTTTAAAGPATTAGGSPSSSGTTAAPATDTTAAPVSNTDPIKIGVCLGLTGPGSAAGPIILNGLQYGVDELNAAGGINGRMVELVTFDDGNDAAMVVPGLTKLIEEDKVCMMTGLLTPFEWAAAVPVMEQAKMPCVSITTAPASAPTSPYVFIASPSATIQAKAFVTLVLKEGYKNVMMAADQIPTYQEALKLVQADLEKAGVKVTYVADSWDYSAADFTPVIQKLYDQIQQVQPDAFILEDVPNDHTAIVHGLSAMGVTIPIIGNAITAFPMMLFMGGAEGVQNARFIAPAPLNAYSLPDDEPIKPLAVKFSDGFLAKYNQPTDMVSTTGYSNWLVILEGLKAGVDDPAKIRDGLEAIKNLQTLEGIVTYSPTDHNTGAVDGYYEFKVVGEKFEFVTPLR